MKKAENPEKYHPKHIKQTKPTNALIDFVAEDLLPLAVVDSCKFKKFVEILDPMYKVPSRKHFSSVLLRSLVQSPDEIILRNHGPLHIRRMGIGVSHVWM